MRKISSIGDFGSRIPKDLSVDIEIEEDAGTPKASSQKTTMKKVDIDTEEGDDEDEKMDSMAIIIARYQLVYSVAGLLVGLFCIVGGIALFFNGIAGNISWTAKLLGGESKISDAAPGAILFIVGFLFVWVTRFDVAIKRRIKR